MSQKLSRRNVLAKISAALAAACAAPAAQAAKATVQKVLVESGGAKGYDPTKHKWAMAIDASRCIGCGSCADACKKENHVPEGHYYRTWIERYVITKPKPGSDEARGEVLVDSPEGGMHGFGPCPVPKEELLQSFFVPKLCNLCLHSPCAQVCPVGCHVRFSGWCGSGGPQILHRLRFLHPGLPLRLPVHEPGDAYG